MRLTEQTRYAVRVLAACAKVHPQVVAVKRVAGDTGLTEFTIFKLLKTATKAGLVASVRGRNGGIRLAMEPEQLTLGSVVRAFELRFQECRPAREMLDDGCGRDCVDRKLNGMIGQGFAAFLETLDAMTIADLVEQEDRQWAVYSRSRHVGDARGQASNRMDNNALLTSFSDAKLE